MNFKESWARGAAIGGGLGLLAPFLAMLIWGGDQAPLLAIATVPIGLIVGAIVGSFIGVARKPRGPQS
jgi:hypothetical protein